MTCGLIKEGFAHTFSASDDGGEGPAGKILPVKLAQAPRAAAHLCSVIVARQRRALPSEIPQTTRKGFPNVATLAKPL